MISILLVDDETALLDVTRIFLEKEGTMEVTTAESALVALDLLNTQTYDVIVSDYEMPQMNGIEFLRTVKSNGIEIPFIIFTGRGREHVVIDALNLGADFYLQKGGHPRSQFAELKNMIEQAVNRKRTELALVRSERRLSDIINFLPDATLAIDREGRVIAWNRSIEKMTGVPAADMLGRGDYEYALPFYGERRPLLIDLIFESSEEIQKRYYGVIHKKGDVLIGETDIPRLQGKNVILWGKASPLYDERGNIVGAIESIRDVTERRKIKEALAQSEQYYRAIVDDQVDFVCRFGPDFTFTFVNKAFCRLFGIPCGELLGKPFPPFIPTAQRDYLIRSVQSLTPDNPVGMVEHQLDLRGGETRWYQWVNRAFFGSSGEVIEYQGVGRDITERRRMEEALRESEARYKAVVETQEEFICRFLPDGTHIFANPAYCRYFGRDCSDIIGSRFRPFVPEEDRNMLRRHFASLRPDAPAGNIRHRIVMPDGEVYWQSWNDRAIFDEDGAILEYQSVGRDITDIIQAEEAVLLANRKLNLLYTITRHDILNQVTALMLHLELAKEKSGNPEMSEFIDKVMRISRNIERLIEFTREYEDIGVRAPLWQDIREVISKALHSLDLTGVSVRCDLGPVEVYADPLLERVFFNLSDNALKYSRNATEISFSTEPSIYGLILCIEDNGVGIADQDKERIFDKGYGKGTGFGLFLAREILDITGISIIETGEPGAGARFEIFIPRGTYRTRGS